MSKPTIDVGDAVQKSRLPGWLKRIFSWFRGLVIHTGPVDIRLDADQTIPPARTGLDRPARVTPPTQWGPHR